MKQLGKNYNEKKLYKFYKMFTVLLLLGLSIFSFGFSPSTSQASKIIIANKTQELAINNVLQLLDENKIEQAYLELVSIKNLDAILSNVYADKFNNLIKSYKPILVKKANNLIQENNHKFAINLLNSSLKHYENDPQISTLLSICQSKISSSKLVEYSGPVEHLHLKSLLAFPQTALNLQNLNHEELDTEHITPFEFEKILYSLYNKNYVLIKPSQLIEWNDGDFISSKILLPVNKKPLILSFDDISYKSPNSGLVDKLILDRNKNIATYTSKKSINERISYNNEYVTLLENFIETNSDFSHNKAKGLIFITGSDGILGYKTQKSNTTIRYEIKKAQQIVNKLLSLGWEFGGTNYYTQPVSYVSEMDITKNLSKWKDEVETIIGKSQIYYLKNTDFNQIKSDTTQNFKIKLLKENGFNLFVVKNNGTKLQHLKTQNGTKLIILPTKIVNGETLRNNATEFEHLFNCKNVYDHAQRKKPFSQ